MGTLSQSHLKLCPLTPNTRGKWTHLLIYLFRFCSFIPKNSVFAGGHTGEYLLHNLHYHPSPGIHKYKKILPNVLLHLTEIDVKTCFDVKTVSLNEKQTAKVFAMNMNERQSSTEMIEVHWIQIILKWTR